MRWNLGTLGAVSLLVQSTGAVELNIESDGSSGPWLLGSFVACGLLTLT